jgi:hypothetical protein
MLISRRTVVAAAAVAHPVLAPPAAALPPAPARASPVAPAAAPAQQPPLPPLVSGPSPRRAPGSVRSVAFGLDYVEGIRPLRHTEADARKYALTLLRYAPGLTEGLGHGAGTGSFVVSGHVTRAQLLAELDDAVWHSPKRGTYLFYFSGHGRRLMGGGGAEHSEQTGSAVVMSDGMDVWDTEIQAAAAAMQCPSLFVFDACFSGDMARADTRVAAACPGPGAGIKESPPPVRAVALSSSWANATSIESAYVGGLFTSCLCSTIEQAYDTRNHRSSLRTLQQLVGAVDNLMAARLARSGLSQSPVLRVPVAACDEAGAVVAASAQEAIQACLFG